MSAIEQRARELLAAIPASPTPEDESERVMVWDKDALAAIIAALTPPEGYVLVPVRPTDEMLEQFKRPRFVGLTLGDRYARMLATRPEVEL